MTNSYLNGAFVFDYTKEKPELIVSYNDELQWLCITQNITNLKELEKCTDDYDSVTPIGSIDNDTAMRNYEQNLKSAESNGISEEQYLAQFGITKKEFENLQKRIAEKYGDGLNFNLPVILCDRSEAEQCAGTHPDFDYIFDPYFSGYDDLKMDMGFCDYDFVFRMMGLKGGVEEALKIAKENDGVLLVDDDSFNYVKASLPYLFEIGAMGHMASLRPEWLPTDCIEDLFIAPKKVSGVRILDRELRYEGTDNYKDEYARYLLQIACVDNNIKLELNVDYDSVKNDMELSHNAGEINWQYANNGIYDMSNNQIIRFYSANDELKRVYFTSSGQFHNAEYIARSLMSKDESLAYATADLKGDVANIKRIENHTRRQ